MLARSSLLLVAAAAAALKAPPEITRRRLLSLATAFGSLPACQLARADGLTASAPSFEAFVAAQQQQQLTDPYAAVREQDPNRGLRFADEAPPLSAGERLRKQQAAVESIYSTENRARPAPLVSSQGAAPSVGTLSLSDEYSLEFDSSRPLGLEFKDLRVGFEYGTREGSSRVLVANVVAGGQAASTGKVQIDDIVVAVDGVNVERESAKEVSARLVRAKAEGRPVQVTLKDALAFNERLNDLPKDREEAMAPIATRVAPGGGPLGEPEQVLSIRRLEVQSRCTRNAQSGDLVEIRYTGRLADGTVFDGMELAGRFGDDSLQFVLGKQPAGQFPPAWDVGLVGMCVGERRLLDVPPVLGFGAKGLPKRNVPPNARLLYDVELLAINALSTP